MDKKGKEVSIDVVCINDSGKPESIPNSKWLKKDQNYTIKEFCIHNIQNKIIGVKLWEIDLAECYPYISFSLTRFGICTDKLALEAQKAIDELLKETLTKEEITV